MVVLNYNGGPLVLRALDALARTEWPAGCLDVVVVDNASVDGTPDTIARLHPNVEVRRFATNRGFPANNEALRDLDGVDYVALINPDALVEPRWLAPLVEALDADPGLGAACPLVLFADLDGTPSATSVVNSAGGVVRRDGYAGDRAVGETDLRRVADPVDVFAWTGAAVLLRPAYLRDVGLFDERFFLYYEDTDLSWRGRRQGWRYRYVPTSVVHHVHAASTGSGSTLQRFHSERNRLCMLVKNAPAGVAVRAVVRFPLSTASYALSDVVAALVRGRRPRTDTVALRLRAYASFLRLVPAMLADRRRQGRRARVDDAVLAQELATALDAGVIPDRGRPGGP